MHPDPAILLRCLDGELTEKRSRRAALHLQKCPSCRLETDRMDAALKRFQELDAASLVIEPVPMQQGLDRLMVSIGAWRGSHPEASASWGLKSRLAAQLEIFLGERAAQLVQRADRARTPGRAVSAIQPLLAAFLGRNAASALIMQILKRLKGDRKAALDVN